MWGSEFFKVIKRYLFYKILPSFKTEETKVYHNLEICDSHLILNKRIG